MTVALSHRTLQHPNAVQYSIFRYLVVIIGVLCLLGMSAPSAWSLTVGTPTTDANGVKSYPVTSIYQGSQQQFIRVLEPTATCFGKARRILYILPVETGVTSLSSQYSDGLEVARLANIHNRFNMVLIAPSFNYEPWYGDNPVDTTGAHRMESFIVNDLVPFGDTFVPGASSSQRLLIGFSKSGNGVLDLILRHPDVFSAAAAWDAPAVQIKDISAFPQFQLPLNFGNQANYNLYYIPTLVTNNAQSFQTRNRLWISGDGVYYTPDMTTLHQQLTSDGIVHTWVAGSATRAHSWNSGWVDGAITDLDAHSTAASSSVAEAPLSENGMWDTPGAWPALDKNNGVYSNTISAINGAARMACPTVIADQFAEITYDQAPGSTSWAGVMTRVQGRTNGGGYLAIVYSGQVQLYRTDDNGNLGFALLAAVNAALGTAPRRLRLESLGSTHRVYFNGALVLTFTDTTFTAGQPGIADSAFSGGPTIKILSFSGGAL